MIDDLCAKAARNNPWLFDCLGVARRYGVQVVRQPAREYNAYRLRLPDKCRKCHRYVSCYECGAEIIPPSEYFDARCCVCREIYQRRRVIDAAKRKLSHERHGLPENHCDTTAKRKLSHEMYSASVECVASLEADRMTDAELLKILFG